MDRTNSYPLESINITIEDDTYPRINLSTSEDVRREMAKVYRETRSQQLNLNAGTKLIYILTQILRAHEVYAIESRLSKLENSSRRNIR